MRDRERERGGGWGVEQDGGVREKFSGVVTMTSGMLGRCCTSGLRGGVLAKRRGFFAGGTGNASGSEWLRRRRVGLSGCGGKGLSLLALASSFNDDLRRSMAAKLKSNDRGVATSTMGDGIESLTPAAPMRVGRSWRLKGSTGVSLPSDWMVRRVSVDLLDRSTLLIRISWSRVGDSTSSTSRRLNMRTMSRSLAFTDHFDRDFLVGTDRAFLPFLDFWDFCLFAFEIEADLVGDLSGDKAGFGILFLFAVCRRGGGLLNTGGVGGRLAGGGVVVIVSTGTAGILWDSGFPSLTMSLPTVQDASSISLISCCTFPKCPSGACSGLGMLTRLGGVGGVGGVGGMRGMGMVICSLSGWISSASSRSKVNLVGLGRDFTDCFFLISVGRRGEGRGFSSGEPGGGDILLSLTVFDLIIDARTGVSPGLPFRGSRRGDENPAA